MITLRHKNNNIAIIDTNSKIIEIDKQFKTTNDFIKFIELNDIIIKTIINNSNEITNELKRIDVIQSFIKSYKIDFKDLN